LKNIGQSSKRNMVIEMYNLNRRRILLTGAAGGLGTPLAASLEAAGAHVVALVRDIPNGGIEGATDAHIIAVDLADATALEFAVRAEIIQNGPFDTVINNAAYYPKAKITELAAEEMQTVLQINAIAPSVLTRVCSEAMIAADFGRVINIASITFDLGFKELSAYVASKGALIGMARTWARELGPHGISVNTVSPGAFQTDAEKIHPNPEEYNQFVLDQQALKRRGKPADFANLVMFLISEESGFITGQNIRVDGGWVTQ
jgi:3-oxoacyl-[acyl-carrier protein] reductase